MIVLVCGGRDYKDRQRVYTILSNLHRTRGITKIVCGGARGADRLAAEWALDNNIDLRTYNADWKAYPRTAGLLRNGRMLDSENVSLIVAFPGGAGTRHMISLGNKFGVGILEILNDS